MGELGFLQESSEKLVKIKVYRYDPSQDDEPSYQTYEIPLKYDNMTILGLLMYIYEKLDPSLAFMYSCCRLSEQGRCGICDMFINGKGEQACTFIVNDFAEKGEILVEPPFALGFPIIKDLIASQYSLADREKFFIPRANALHKFRQTYAKIKG
jgi:succinate dehydrogenase/fumarate reductase-like Fe-S protein